jgi:hypothetical protein
MIAAAVKHPTIVRAPPKHGGRNRNGRRRGRHSLLLHRPLIGGGRGKEMIPVIAFHGGVSRGDVGFPILFWGGFLSDTYPDVF